MRRLIALIALAAALASPAFAQNPPPYVTDTNGTLVPVQPTYQVGSSGASGGAAAFGPTPTGTAAANPPVLMGGTRDGTPTGLVQGQKCLSGGACVITQIAAPTSTDDITPVANTAVSACYVVSAQAASVFSISGYVAQASFIEVTNTTTIPADGAVTPLAVAYAASAGSFSIDYGALPARFTTGVTVCASTTGPFTKTATGATNYFSARIKQ